MREVIVHWLRRVLGVTNTRRRVEHTGLPTEECFRDAFKRGARLHRLGPSDLPEEFKARLLEVCRADPNVAGLWLSWISSSSVRPELAAGLLLDRPDESAIRYFIERADAIGGPRFVATNIRGIPRAKPFYRRSGNTAG